LSAGDRLRLTVAHDRYAEGANGIGLLLRREPDRGRTDRKQWRRQRHEERRPHACLAN
jgi:hypothetical protein